MANNLVFQEIFDGGGESGGEEEVTIELDTTLTQEGKAADAKAVGDALAGLATEGYVDGEISDALSKFDTDIKEYIQNTFLNGAW